MEVIKNLNSVKLYTMQNPDCYYILKDGRVVYLGLVYQGIKSLACHFMGANITLEQVQELEEIVSIDL